MVNHNNNINLDGCKLTMNGREINWEIKDFKLEVLEGYVRCNNPINNLKYEANIIHYNFVPLEHYFDLMWSIGIKKVKKLLIRTYGKKRGKYILNNKLLLCRFDRDGL